MMAGGNCVHVNILGDYTTDDILKKTRESICDTCSVESPNLWLCLHYDCLYVGCGEQFDDHSTLHFKNDPYHCLILNLTTLRLWCYLCECEVFLSNMTPPTSLDNRRIPGRNVSIASADPDTDDDTLEDEKSLIKPRGLAGLQNIGNSCYMNAAIQALSNCPPLTNFFLDCSAFVRFQSSSDGGSTSDKKPNLSKNYLKLMIEMWHKKRPSYLVPSSVAYGIKTVCPMFRGYTQQDSQEFLRCFMDQIHEELKQPCSIETPSTPTKLVSRQQQQQQSVSTASSPSAASLSSSSSSSLCCMDVDPDYESGSQSEYETCDSGVSSEKSSCGEEVGCVNVDTKFSSRRNSSFGAGGNRRQFSMEDGYYLRPGGNSPASHRSVTSTHIVSNNNGATRVRSLSASMPHVKPVRSNSTSASSSGRAAQGILTAGVHATSQMQGSSKIGRRKRQPKYRSIISDVFDGKILSSVQCLTCDRVSSTKETFQDLSLPIPSREFVHVLHASQSNPQQHQQQQKGPLSTCTDVYSNQGWFSWMFSWMKSFFWGPTVSLHDCLSAFFSADDLKGDNMYSCEKCKKLRNGIKYSKVLELPEILCVHLKRFRHEVMFSAKLNTYVSFPLEGLDMQPFLHADCPSTVTSYDLVAVICHHGTAGGGHYTSYALNCLNDQWYEFDDQYVTEVDYQVVANCEAYVLFYRKTSDETMRKRQRAVELIEMCKREPSLMQFYISKQWVNKFNTFAEPGPIDNTDFLCSHGGVHPSKVGYAQELCTILSQGVWEYLYHSFGGGPTCTRLYLCANCLQEMDAIESRRKCELDEFIRLHEEFRVQKSSGFIYVVAMSWFRMWENFVKGKEHEPPGPIDNTVVADNKDGQFVLRPGDDYAQVSEEIWSFFHNIYGGGPVLTMRQGVVINNFPTSASAGGDSGIASAVSSSNASLTNSNQSSVIQPIKNDATTFTPIPPSPSASASPQRTIVLQNGIDSHSDNNMDIESEIDIEDAEINESEVKMNGIAQHIDEEKIRFIPSPPADVALQLMDVSRVHGIDEAR